MKCPFCSHVETQVLETRVSEDADVVRRRRQCGACEKRFNTFERAELALPLVAKRDGRRTEYSRAKIFSSMSLAMRKRGIGIEQIDAAIKVIEERLLSSGEREVSSTLIGEMVMEALKKLDKVAYIRFASVYRSFEDAHEFSTIAKQLT